MSQNLFNIIEALTGHICTEDELSAIVDAVDRDKEEEERNG